MTEIEMAGISQKGLGSFAPQQLMPLELPGWLDQREHLAEYCLFVENFSKLLRTFSVVQNFLGLPALRNVGAFGLARTGWKVTWC